MLYDIAFFIFSIFYLPALIFKGKLHSDFLERFGLYNENKRKALASGRDRIWIQAVSVGEVALCKNFIPLLKAKFPDSQIVLSTITKTGNDLAKKIFAGAVTVIYFPLDFSFVARKVTALIRPRLYIMIETEIWPNIIRELRRNSIPAILINGRISDRSYGKYRLARPFLKNILEEIDSFCMQSQKDAMRIEGMGAPSGKVRITGNMKFDIDIALKEPMQRSMLGLEEDDELLVAGSTHAGEEEIALEVFKELFTEFTRLRLLIAPRHIERVSEIESVVKRFGLDPVRISKLKGSMVHGLRSTVFILDTIGQLNDVYSIATLVFVGGSLVRHGGQNPIEPAIFRRAVIFGPHMFNFTSIADIFLKNRAALQINSKKDLLTACRSLLRDEGERSRMGDAAKRTVSENRGATERNLEAICKILYIR